MNDYKELVRSLRMLFMPRHGEEISIEQQAADVIEQLVKERDEFHDVSLFQAEEIGHMLGSINKLRIERDAAVEDLKTVCQHYNISNICDMCSGKHCRINVLDSGGCEWEWRGVQE